jgi:hypothetical protein
MFKKLRAWVRVKLARYFVIYTDWNFDDGRSERYSIFWDIFLDNVMTGSHINSSDVQSLVTEWVLMTNYKN